MHSVEIGRLHSWQMLRYRRSNYGTDHVVVAHCSTSMDFEPLLNLLATHGTRHLVLVLLAGIELEESAYVYD